jgi:regulator of protease activity HflC (stomatin/prohibitin superfamily)
MLQRMSSIYLIVFTLFLGVRACALTYVEIGKIGVRYNNAGGLLESDLEPGWHLAVAGMHKVWQLPAHYIIINYAGSQRMSIRTEDNNTVEMDISIPYRVIPQEGWMIMKAGNHLMDGNGNYRFQRFAEQTATSVLRENLARLRSEDFYNTEKRQAVASSTLKILNEHLRDYHLEASKILVRATYFRGEYEQQLASIQLNEQKKLLDYAKESVAQKQQALDNYEQHTNAMQSAKEQQWAQKIARLEGAYQVGFVDIGTNRKPGAARRVLSKLLKVDKRKLKKQALQVFEIEAAEITDGHLIGIKNIEAETVEYDLRIRAEGEGISGRLKAEANAEIAKVKGAYEARLNQLLGSPAGRAYVAYNAAANVTFAPTLTFHSGDGIPSILRLGRFAKDFLKSK